jgi:hypothetical protein
MNLSVHITGALLLVLVFTMSLSAIYLKGNPILINVIFALSAFKFLLVAFQFMEMKKANSFWKVILVLFVGIVFSAFRLMIS